MIDQDVAPQVDSGLLVIHGVGAHARTSTLKNVVDPFIDRLSREQTLVDVSAMKVGTEDALGGSCDALLIRYQTTIPATKREEKRTVERKLLAVEGRWSDVFLKAGPSELIAWSGRHAIPMTWELLCYNYRSLKKALGAFAILLLVAAAIVLGSANSLRLFWGCIVALPFVVFLSVRDDAAAVRRNASSIEAHISWFAALGMLGLEQLQRALVILVTAGGLVVLPILAAVLSWSASVPFLAGASFGLMEKIQAVLLNGGAADMEAVASNHVTAAEIRTRLRNALVEVESRVRPGGTITVVAHSGGAPPAWRILSEPEIRERSNPKDLRYRLITVGAALNWAVKGFGCRATPLEGALVNSDAKAADQTIWLNVYSSWDPVPHGPAPCEKFLGWRSLEGVEESAEFGDTPNYPVRNLGAPVPDEHGEYWNNQHEFVPLMASCIDSEMRWTSGKPGEHRQLWANYRLALLSALVRTRLVVLALPVAAGVVAIQGTRFFESGDPDFGWPHSVAASVSWLLRHVMTAKVFDYVADTRALSALLVVALLTLASYGVMDVYTSLCWRSLGEKVPVLPTPIPSSAKHRTRTGSTRRQHAPLGAAPLKAMALIWLPTFVLLPALMFPFLHFNPAWWLILGINTLLVILECLWLNSSLRAFLTDEGVDLRRVFETPIGRQRTEAQMETPAGDAAFRQSAVTSPP